MFIQVTNSKKIPINYYVCVDRGVKKKVNVNKQVMYKEIIGLFESKRIIGVGLQLNGIGDVEYLDYKEFRQIYKTLDSFYMNIVDECIYFLYKTMGIVINKKEVKFKMESTTAYDGLYVSSKKEVLLRMSLVKEAYRNSINRYNISKVKGTIYHEIGHYIHDVYFNNAILPIPEKSRRGYATKDNLENFACCFENLCIAIEEGEVFSERDKYMHNLMCITFKK